MAGKGKLRERRYEVEPEVTFKMKINEQSGPIDATRASTRPGARIAAFAPRGGGDGRGAAIIIVNDGRSISLVETLEIGSGTDGMALFLAFSAKHAATQSLIVTPHESTVARVTEVPAGELAEMVGAAELLAEAGLPSSVASWRRGGGLVGGRTRVGIRQVLLTGWITRPGEVDKYVASGGHGERASAKAARSLSAPSTFCTPMAALAMLMGESAAGAYVDGAGHAYVGDAADAGVGGSGGSGGSGRGAGVLVLSGEKSVSRVLLGDDEESPLVGAARALSVAAHAAGLTDDDLPAVDGAMCLTVRAQQELCSRVGGLPSSGEGRELREWLNRFGLALGAALTRCVRGGEGLSNLRFAAVPVVASAPVRAAVWVSGGRRAAGLIAAGCVALLCLPWLLAHARNEVLSGRAQMIERMKRENADIEKRAAMFSQLEVNRWPLTKILSDLSGATPVGVVAVDIRLNPEQGLTFDGTAEKPELVTAFQGNLSASKLFRNVKVNRSESGGSVGVGFNLTAEVAVSQAHALITPIENFATKSLAVRLHGEEGAAQAASNVSSEEAKPAARRGDRKPVDTETDKKPGIVTDALPAVVSDDDIKKMDKPTAQLEWIARKVYVQKNPTLDAAVKQRLAEEEAKIRAHAATAPSPPPKKPNADTKATSKAGAK